MIIPGQVFPKAQGPHAPQLNTSIVKSGLAKVLATARKAPVTPCDCDLQISQDGQSPHSCLVIRINLNSINWKSINLVQFEIVPAPHQLRLRTCYHQLPSPDTGGVLARTPSSEAVVEEGPPSCALVIHLLLLLFLLKAVLLSKSAKTR